MFIKTSNNNEIKISVYDCKNALISNVIESNKLDISLLNEAFNYFDRLNMRVNNVIIHPNYLKLDIFKSNENSSPVESYKQINKNEKVIIENKLWGANLEFSDKVDVENIYVVGIDENFYFSILKIVIKEI